MQNTSCLICHVLFASVSSTLETPFLSKCCNRWVCYNCLEHNPRFYTYCPFCQKVALTYKDDEISNIVEPPSYEEVIYNDLNKFHIPKSSSFNEKSEKLNVKSHSGTIHHVKKDDTLIGLAFKYGIEVFIFKRINVTISSASLNKSFLFR